MISRTSKFLIALTTFIVLVIGAITFSNSKNETEREEEVTIVCNEQGLVPFKITQYGRPTLWFCKDEDGVLRVPEV